MKDGRKLNRLWKEIETHSHKYRVKTPIRDEGGKLIAVQVEVFPRYKDPSLRDQLYERGELVEAERVKAYLQSTQMEPHASEDTKRKWRRAAQLD